LSHGSENWTITARDARRTAAAAEIKYMRKKKRRKHLARL